MTRALGYRFSAIAPASSGPIGLPPLEVLRTVRCDGEMETMVPTAARPASGYARKIPVNDNVARTSAPRCRSCSEGSDAGRIRAGTPTRCAAVRPRATKGKCRSAMRSALQCRRRRRFAAVVLPQGQRLMKAVQPRQQIATRRGIEYAAGRRIKKHALQWRRAVAAACENGNRTFVLVGQPDRGDARASRRAPSGRAARTRRSASPRGHPRSHSVADSAMHGSRRHRPGHFRTTQ